MANGLTTVSASKLQDATFDRINHWFRTNSQSENIA